MGNPVDTEKKTVIDERLRRQLDFSLEIDKEKNILRQTHLSGYLRRENDAEHAWHMAIMAFLFKEYANEEVDIARVMIMCLIHDIVEIDAGRAKERIFSILPEDQKEELTAIFDEFEANETMEAKYAHAMDNLQPLMLNDCNDGRDWQEHQVTSDKIYNRQKKTKLGSEKLFSAIDEIIQKNIRKGRIKN